MVHEPFQLCEDFERFAEGLHFGLFDLLHTGVALLSKKGVFLYCNKAFLEMFGFSNDVADRAAHERSPQLRNDAEGAVMIAAFADLEVGIVTGREPNARRGNEVAPGFVGPRQMAFDEPHHLLDLIGPRDAEHLRHLFGNEVRTVRVLLSAEASADDHAAVLVERFGDRLKTLRHGFVHEAAGVHDDEVGLFVRLPDAVAAGAQFGDDALGVDERLGAAEGNESDNRNFLHRVSKGSAPCEAAVVAKIKLRASSR